MLRSVVRYWLIPGAFPAWLAMLVSVLAMLSLFAFDIGTTAIASVHSLYIFPLVMIVIHCPQPALVLVGLAAAMLLQTATLFAHDVAIPVIRAELVIALVSSILMIVLARAFRESFLETADLAAHDSLTALLNRRSFQALMDAEIERQRRYGGVFSLAIIDLDDFKRLNDTRGHREGDEALAWLGVILKRNTRQTDAVCRLGGDEFAVMMPNTDASECGKTCAELVATVAREMQSAHIGITACAGYATFDRAPDSTSAALQCADAALYAAKAAGKSTALGNGQQISHTCVASARPQNE